MLRAGNTASRTREWMDVLARKLGCDGLSLSLSLDGIIATLRRSGVEATRMREVGAPGANASRLAALEQLAKAARLGVAPREVASRLAEIESAKPAYSTAVIVGGIGVASSAFAFLNGAAFPEMAAAAIGGASGQLLRWWLSHRRLNQFGVAALASLTASGVYVLTAALMARAGFEFAHYPAGFIASVLFLVPGFPMIAGLFDLLRHETVAGVSRLAYGVMMLLAVAFGLSIVVGVAGIDVSRQPPLDLAYPLKLLLRAIASFVAGAAFAMLFASSRHTVLAVGLVAVVANGLRLGLADLGMMLAPAAYFATLVIGLVALLADRRFDVPRMAMAVAPTIIMVPGLYAFETIVLLNRGDMLDAMKALAACSFIIGALAMGLATARLFGPR